MISEFWSLWSIVLYTTIISMPYLRLAHKLNKSCRAKKTHHKRNRYRAKKQRDLRKDIPKAPKQNASP
jgi:hypothetical protein